MRPGRPQSRPRRREQLPEGTRRLPQGGVVRVMELQEAGYSYIKP